MNDDAIGHLPPEGVATRASAARTPTDQNFVIFQPDKTRTEFLGCHISRTEGRAASYKSLQNHTAVNHQGFSLGHFLPKFLVFYQYYGVFTIVCTYCAFCAVPSDIIFRFTKPFNCFLFPTWGWEARAEMVEWMKREICSKQIPEMTNDKPKAVALFFVSLSFYCTLAHNTYFCPVIIGSNNIMIRSCVQTPPGRLTTN